jgi:Zn ribbon nucleic-acid-binding protein
MSKVSQECPICSGNYIVLMLNENSQSVWPECWKCGFGGHTEEDKEALRIDKKLNPNMSSTELFKQAAQLWGEYLALLEQTTPKKEENN